MAQAFSRFSSGCLPLIHLPAVSPYRWNDKLFPDLQIPNSKQFPNTQAHKLRRPCGTIVSYVFGTFDIVWDLEIEIWGLEFGVTGPRDGYISHRDQHALESLLERRGYLSLFFLFSPVLRALFDVTQPGINISFFMSFRDHVLLVTCDHGLNGFYPFDSLGVGER